MEWGEEHAGEAGGVGLEDNGVHQDQREDDHDDAAETPSDDGDSPSFEGDLRSCAKNSYIATLAERHSRFAMLVKVPSKEMEAVVSALSQQVRIPEELRTRLESLKLQFYHPNNLPARSYPATPIPARVN